MIMMITLLNMETMITRMFTCFTLASLYKHSNIFSSRLVTCLRWRMQNIWWLVLSVFTVHVSELYQLPSVHSLCVQLSLSPSTPHHPDCLYNCPLSPTGLWPWVCVKAFKCWNVLLVPGPHNSTMLRTSLTSQLPLLHSHWSSVCSL